MHMQRGRGDKLCEFKGIALVFLRIYLLYQDWIGDCDTIAWNSETRLLDEMRSHE